MLSYLLATAEKQQKTFLLGVLSRRVAAIETDGAKKTETRYTWCGNVICQARDAQDNPVAWYFTEGAYRPQEKGHKKQYYAKDHLGSIRDVLDGQGQPIARYDYGPYGDLASGPGKKPEFGYAGMHYHALSGLYLTHYRAYDPQSGRWLSRDPLEEAGASTCTGTPTGTRSVLLTRRGRLQSPLLLLAVWQRGRGWPRLQLTIMCRSAA
jgi:RHS repeat-associated protein